MLEKISLIVVSLSVLCLLFGGSLYASEKFGMVFDIQGKVQILSADGKKITLRKDKDVLRPVYEGDRIKVSGTGKVVIVSLKDKTGYEITSNSEAVIKNKKIVKIKGDIKTVEGLHPPDEDFSEMGGKSIGALVLRGLEPCIRIASPVNTSILELSPELRWSNNCQGLKKVSVRILYEDNVVYRVETESNSIKVPEGILRYGAEYSWLVDGGEAYNIAGGRFSIPEETDAKEIREKISYYKQQENNLSGRLSYVFYLLEKNLNELAKDEIEKLKKEFPENDYIKGM